MYLCTTKSIINNMEYIVSARKYRPLSFDTVVGQAALTTTLKNAVKSGKLAHAYLFCGPRGVGKTTCARIFAKAINCQHPTAEGEACNECESCQSFNEQRSLNIFELDAASNNSVEHIKTLMEQTRIPPQLGKYARAGGFTHTSRTAKKVGMSQLSALYCVLQSSGQCSLPHNRVET